MSQWRIMSQWWYTIDVDKKETYTHGKFGEWFYGDIGHKLTYQLLRRITLPVDPLSNGGGRLKGLKLVNFGKCLC